MSFGELLWDEEPQNLYEALVAVNEMPTRTNPVIKFYEVIFV